MKGALLRERSSEGDEADNSLGALPPFARPGHDLHANISAAQATQFKEVSVCNAFLADQIDYRCYSHTD